MLGKDASIIKTLLKHCKGRNHPWVELNGVLVSGNKLVATDTRQLLVLEFAEHFTEESLTSPVMLCDNKEDLVRPVERPLDYPIILTQNDAAIDEIGLRLVKMQTGKFPDFQRMLFNEERIKTIGDKLKKQSIDFDSETTFADCIMLLGSYFSSKTLLKFIEIAEKLNPIDVEIKQTESIAPLQIEGILSGTQSGLNIKFQYVVMPIIVFKEEKK